MNNGWLLAALLFYAGLLYSLYRALRQPPLGPPFILATRTIVMPDGTIQIGTTMAPPTGVPTDGSVTEYRSTVTIAGAAQTPTDQAVSASPPEFIGNVDDSVTVTYRPLGAGGSQGPASTATFVLTAPAPTTALGVPEILSQRVIVTAPPA